MLLTDVKTNLGASLDYDGKKVTFRLYSKNAQMVILCIFEKPKGQDALMNLEMHRIEGSDIWETSVKTYALKNLKEPVFYGYRIFGANWQYRENFKPGTGIGFISRVDKDGNRFNPNKLAYDPYAKELSHLPSDVSQNLEIFRSGGDNYLYDNAKEAPKSVFWLDTPKEITTVETRPFSQEVIAEVHIKDLTKNLPMQERGTYLGAAKFAPVIKRMGFTMVEFLPLQEFDFREDGQNYWGYMTLDYFAPARHYAYNKNFGKVLDEFREMVDAFHKNGLKVCMDVVYNHTGEARIHWHNNDDASLLSYALIDNQSYYKLVSNSCEGGCDRLEVPEKKYYRQNSGCHNDTNSTNEGFYNLVADSVAFWAHQGVDAFRFDLAVSLMDVSKGEEAQYCPHTSLCAHLSSELEKRGVSVINNPAIAQNGIMLIAEPWTCGGANCYQLGNFPHNWMEWNDVSRDTIRRAALFGNHINLDDVINIFEGTKSRFHNKYGAINYICCHDGFSLYDCNSFSKRDPNTTGGSDWEICSDNQNKEDIKENAIKKELAMLFLSKGVPMMQLGDIIMHSKCGNNNSYNRDDETNYYDYTLANKKGSFENRIFDFCKNLINFRKSNRVFSSFDYDKRLTYYNEHSQLIDTKSDNLKSDYNRNYIGIRVENEGYDFFIAFSKHPFDYKFKLPKADEGKNWYILFDTSNKEHITFEQKAFFGLEYVLNPNSLVVFKEC